MLKECAGACAQTCTCQPRRLVAQAPEQGAKKKNKKENKKQTNKKKGTFYFYLRGGCTLSLLHCPGGAHHKPAMTRGRGRAFMMRSAAVRGPRSEVTSCLRRCWDTCSSPASLWPPSSRPCRRSWSLRSASSSACETTAAGSLRTPGLQG